MKTPRRRHLKSFRFFLFLLTCFTHCSGVSIIEFEQENVGSVSLRIQSECGKMQTRITPSTDTFHAVESNRKNPY